MGRTPLHLAAGSGRIKLLEFLLQLGNSKSPLPQTNRKLNAYYLLGCDPIAKDVAGRTPALHALWNSQLEAVQRLLQEGRNVTKILCILVFHLLIG